MTLKVFISWSGNESKFVASNLRELLKLVCAGVDLWLSKEDATGTVWTYELIKQLQSTSVGIICVNRSNLNSPWLHFEAGALAKSLESSAVFPYLINLRPSDLPGPLSIFQSVNADKAGTFLLVKKLNKILRDNQETYQSDADLQILFDAFWSRYESKLKESSNVPLDAGPERSDTEILGELLETVRNHSRILYSILHRSPMHTPPIQPVEQPLKTPDEEYFVFEELRFNAKNLRATHPASALALFQHALKIRPGHLETLIEIPITETYLPNCVYEESIQKLKRLIQENTTEEESGQTEESSIGRAYYNLACIKHLARNEQGGTYSKDDIFKDLENAFQRYPSYTNTALADPDLEKLKGHKKFKELIEKYREAER